MNKKLSANMCDIAKASGVSQATVSRVLRQNACVSPETRARVLDAMRTLGYMSNVTELLYPQHQPSRHFIICFCSREVIIGSAIVLPYFQEIINGIRDSLANVGATSSIEILSSDKAKLNMDGADGIFLLGVPSDKLRAVIRAKRLPCVIISDDIYSDTEDQVTVNNYYSCRVCCQNLITQGVRSIGFLLVNYHAEHLDGFLGEMLRQNVPIDHSLIRLLPDLRLEAEYIQTLQEWIKAGKLPEVLVISFGPQAYSVQNFLVNQGIRVPQDIRLICFTRYQFAKFQYSVIECHPRLMGEQGVKQMLLRCEHPEMPVVTTVIPNTFEEIVPQE